MVWTPKQEERPKKVLTMSQSSISFHLRRKDFFSRNIAIYLPNCNNIVVSLFSFYFQSMLTSPLPWQQTFWTTLSDFVLLLSCEFIKRSLVHAPLSDLLMNNNTHYDRNQMLTLTIGLCRIQSCNHYVKQFSSLQIESILAKNTFKYNCVFDEF